jgi:16S rRNA (uracil1498-N3)-methyltransferase
MHHILLPPEKLRQAIVTIDGADFHHLAHVLRIRVGENIVILDNSGTGWRACIESVGNKALSAKILEEHKLPPEPVIHITVAQAPGKGDRFERVMQHCTEIGASRFIPLLTERTVVKIAKDHHNEKIKRWREIIKGATEQCHRAKMPEISAPMEFSDLLLTIGEYDHPLLLHQHDEVLKSVGIGSTVLLVVGPEGGLSEEEILLWKSHGGRVVSLCPWVLRTETAALTALAKLLP